ncbi:MAG: hypothetical protein ACYTFE_02230, partial [Planctomycetota bacterium]
EDRLQAQGSSELEEAQETTDILKVEYEQEIIKSKTKTLYQAKRLKAEEEKKEYFFVGFETDDHGWIAAGSGQGKFEIGKPVPFEPNEGDCQTACFGTGPSQDQSALGVNAACTNLDGHMAPLDTLFTSSLTSPIYDFSGCSNVSLELWRFMEIEGRNSDFCYYQYKNDPAGQWITFETYGDIEVDDDEWDIYTKDLSAVADGKSYFQLRFYCTTDGWTEGSGLCLDDIMISWSRDDEPQALLPRRIEFDTESEGITDPLIAEYEQEIATFKAKAERGEFEVKKKVSDAGQSEDGSVASDPNTVKSALAALLLKLEAYDVSIEKERELFAPITRVESTSVSRFIGSVYGEIGKVGGTFDEEPGMLNTILGYNVLNTSAEDGVLLLPTFRVLLKRNKSEYDWGNYADYGVGVAYQKTPFIIGAEGVYRDNFENDDLGGEFFRIWGDYWSLWEADTQNFFSSELSRLWGTRYISFEYDTQEENFITDFNADLNLDLFNFKGFIIGPFAEGAINLDTRDEFWNRYGRIGGGLRIRKGPLNIFLESGYKESFNPNDDEGSFYSIYSGIWFPLN